jgi:HTH-type transcriptional regulator/antitoxin HigA
MMDTTLIVIDSDEELARAQGAIARLVGSDNPADQARLNAQARLVAAYEETRWPPCVPSPVAVIAYLMDQHGMSRADMASLLGSPSRASEVLAGKKDLSLSMIRRLRARFGVPADLLIAEAPAKPPRPRRSAKQAAA